MKTNSDMSNADVIRRMLGAMVVYLTYTSLSFFVAYGSMVWTVAWLVLAVSVFYYISLLVLGLKYSPEVLKERATSLRAAGDSWDRFIFPAYILSTIVLNIVAGLDAGRFGWSAVPVIVQYLAFPFVLCTYALPIWAVLSNPFASVVARIQDERGHQVISKGPYRYVRHPMYTSSLIYGISFPLFLGSWWAYIPGAIVIVLFIVRTALEDRMLRQQLPGYREYAQRVPYRLVPGIW